MNVLHIKMIRQHYVINSGWKISCDINHSGSSDSMETAAAVEMFSRSVEKRNVKYSTFVGDGDSSCSAHVKAACFNKYGQGCVVVKEECVTYKKELVVHCESTNVSTNE